MAGFHERYNQARPHWALVAANPATAPARILTLQEVHVQGYAVAPPSRFRWVGWLDEPDQEQAAKPPKQNHTQNFRLEPVARHTARPHRRR